MELEKKRGEMYTTMTEDERLRFLENMKLFKTEFIYDAEEQNQKEPSQESAAGRPEKPVGDKSHQQDSAKNLEEEDGKKKTGTGEKDSQEVKKRRKPNRINLDEIPSMEKEEKKENSAGQFSNFPRYDPRADPRRSEEEARYDQFIGIPRPSSDDKDPLLPQEDKMENASRFGTRYFVEGVEETKKSLRTAKEIWNNSSFLSVRCFFKALI